MSYALGPVSVSTAADTATAVFPLTSQYGWGRADSPSIVSHTFGDGDAKIEQRFYIGPGQTSFTVNLQPMSPTRRRALVTFWEELGGPQNAFLYNAPNEDGITTTQYPVIFDPASALQWTQVNDFVANTTVKLIVIPNPGNQENYPINETLTRFPDAALAAALLGQVQRIIPLVTITPKNWNNSQNRITFGSVSGGSIAVYWSSTSASHTALFLGNPLNPSVAQVVVATGGSSGSASGPSGLGTQYTLLDTDTGRVIASATVGESNPIYISDRYCTIGGQAYYPRLLGHQGISQRLGPADDATFQFGNADRSFTQLKSLVNLNRADVQFCLFHVGTQTLIQMWRGEIKSWAADEGAVFQVTCSDSIYELTLQFPTRTISRSCYKNFNDGNLCPYAAHGSGGNPNYCDKGFDTLNGCQSHGMDNYFGGIIANPQGVNIRDNGSNNRPHITATSIVSDTMYGKPLPQIYTNGLEMPVNCIIADGRDESDFYEAIGIVGEGPIGSFGATQNQLLDGQPQNYPYSPIECVGNDPEPTPFSLDAGGSFQYPYKAAGVARLNIRRTDTKGIQPSTPDSHSMTCTVKYGMQGYVWTAPGGHVTYGNLSNPIWVAVNALLRAQGLIGPGINSEDYFDVASAVAAAAICDLQVSTLVYNRNPVQLPVDGANMGQHSWTPFTPTQPQQPIETQFQFVGVIATQQPLRDWLDQILLNCNGYWYTVFGKVYFGIRENAGAVEAFTIGNMLFKSYSDQPIAPRYDRLTGNFADRDFYFAQNSYVYYDQDYAQSMGAGTGVPRYEDGQLNLSGTCTASQALRILATRCREELGGVNEYEWMNAVNAAWKTTVLALNTNPGQVVSATHPCAQGGYQKLRIQQWTLNYDYSIQIGARTVTESMYDMDAGPKPTDVQPPWLPTLPAVQTVNMPTWLPAYIYFGIGAPPLGKPGYSTFSVFGANYSVVQDPATHLVTVNATMTVGGFAPVTIYFTQTRPTVGSIAGSSAPGGLIAGTTYYIELCGVDANGMLSAPSSKVACTLGSGQTSLQLNNMVFPPGSIGYQLFISDDPDTLGVLGGTNPLVASTIVAFVLADNWGSPPDNWTNVRLRWRAKAVKRLGLAMSVITAYNGPNSITVRNIFSYNGQYVGKLMSVVGNQPTGGSGWTPDTSIITGTNTSGGVSLTSGGSGSVANFIDTPGNPIYAGQVVVIRATADSFSSTSIGCSAWTGIAANDDVGQLVRIIGGTGVGQIREVISNTPTVHTVGQAWDVTPDATSTYIVESPTYFGTWDTPIVENSNPQQPLTMEFPINGITTPSILLLAAMEANGYESIENDAPFRDVAFDLSSPLG